MPAILVCQPPAHDDGWQDIDADIIVCSSLASAADLVVALEREQRVVYELVPVALSRGHREYPRP
jgi:hypothetical protein